MLERRLSLLPLQEQSLTVFSLFKKIKEELSEAPEAPSQAVKGKRRNI